MLSLKIYYSVSSIIIIQSYFIEGDNFILFIEIRAFINGLQGKNLHHLYRHYIPITDS